MHCVPFICPQIINTLSNTYFYEMFFRRPEQFVKVELSRCCAGPFILVRLDIPNAPNRHIRLLTVFNIKRRIFTRLKRMIRFIDCLPNSARTSPNCYIFATISHNVETGSRYSSNANKTPYKQ